MTRLLLVLTLVLAVLAVAATPAAAADDAKVKAATGQIEQGAKKIGAGQVGPGVEETAKGISATIVEGGKFAGKKIEESGKAAEPPARGAWAGVKQGATDFGRSVKRFFSTLFSN